MITIVDYGSGNIRALANVYERLKIEFEVAERAERIHDAKRLILPGVGAFDQTMGKLNESGLREALDGAVLGRHVPVLGICVGMQIMSESSEEGLLPGLGWIPGRVRKFDTAAIPHKPKLPHLGWNSIQHLRHGDLFEGVDLRQGFYFLHSYYFEPRHPAHVLTTTDYGRPFASAVGSENIVGVQFHPEKSHRNGITLLRNFACLAC